MKKIDKNELYQHLRGFLKSKGVALEDGSYAKRLEKGCNLLTEAINTTQSGVERARGKVSGAMNSLRQSIHEATAPRPGSTAAPNPSAPARSRQTGSSAKNSGTGPGATKRRRKTK